MRELVTMWKNTKMVMLTALTAAVYAAILIPFKGIPLIPGITEFRPAQVIAATFPLFFGPAGAWGLAIGNLIGDFFGTLGLGSFFGFFGNLLQGVVLYKMWMILKKEPVVRDVVDFLQYAAAVLVSSAACAAVIAWGLEVLRMLPFAVLGSIIFLNNFVVPVVIGPALLLLLYPRIKSWGLIWTEVMEDEGIAPVRVPGIANALIVIGSLGALIAGLAISTGFYGAEFAKFGVGATGSGVILGVLPFIIVMLIGLAL